MRNSSRVAMVTLSVVVLTAGCVFEPENRPPVIRSSGPEGDVTVPEGGMAVFWVNASDESGQRLTCRWYVDGVLKANGSARSSFQYMPKGAVGEHSVTAVVSDYKFSVERSWNVTVVRTNHPPGFAAVSPSGPVVTLPEGASLEFSAAVSDPDGDPLTTRWLLDGTAVALNVSAFRYEPGYDGSGPHRLVLAASDGLSESSVQWNITVEDKDRPPRFTAWSPLADASILETESVHFSVSAVDDDGDSVFFSWSLDGCLTAAGATYLYVPDHFSSGTHEVTASAFDGKLEANRTWSVTVRNVNRPPWISDRGPAGDVALGEWDSVEFQIAGSDEDGEALSVLWSVDGSPVAADGPRFNYTPGHESAGTHVVRAELSDGIDSAAVEWNASVSRRTAGWTVLVYMNGDNDLETYLLEDLNEMERAGSSSELSIVVQLDRHPSYDGSNGNWNTTRRFRVARDDDTRTIGSVQLEELGEVNMGSGSALEDFLLWGLEHFPARSYQVVLSGHGDGWAGISQDFTNGSARMGPSDITSAVGSFVRARGGAKLEVLQFDVCYWAMLEGWWPLRSQVEVLIGSEDIDPSQGMAYELYLGALRTNVSRTAMELAAGIVSAFEMSYTDGKYWPEDNDTFTLSAVNASGLPDLAARLSLFSDIAAGNMTELRPVLAGARGGVETYGRADYIDLYRFVELVREGSNSSELDLSADGVLSAVESAVLARCHGKYRPASHGISVYFPAQAYTYKSSYGDLDLSSDCSWIRLIQAYHDITGRDGGHLLPDGTEGRDGGGGREPAGSVPGSPLSCCPPSSISLGSEQVARQAGFSARALTVKEAD